MPSKKKTKYNRDAYLKRKYGISLRKYNSMLRKQGNCCEICGKHQKDEKRNFAVDHNHRSGKVRGILCNYCNSKVLKYLGDDPVRAIGLANYLYKYFEWE